MPYTVSMKHPAFFGILVALTFSVIGSSNALSCNECHSKNPKMVKMHQELEFKDCFTCHYPGAGKKPEERKLQMTSDERCARCHKKQSDPSP